VKFCIVALPRSRTAWLAAWLGAEHEPLSRADSLEELPEGVCDTGSVLFFPALFRRYPDARYLFVFRDIADVLASMHSVNQPILGLTDAAKRLETLYSAVRSHDNVRAVRFDQLSDLPTLCAVWAHLKGTPFDAERASRMIVENIQADLAAIAARVSRPRMEALLRSAQGEGVCLTGAR
jgi:hypothetical protein